MEAQKPKDGFPSAPVRRMLLLAAWTAWPAAAAVLAPPFSDHMVLQRDMPVPVWGTADSGEAVTVLFRDQSKTAAAGADGKWRVRLDPLPAGGPHPLILKGKNEIVIRDVLVGEVWLCGGQSNMDYGMEFYPNHADTAKTAHHPQLRFMNMLEGRRWDACGPAAAARFSAPGFYFGRELQKELGVPVGLIESAVGGTALERWMDTATVAADPELARDTIAGVLYRPGIAPLVPFAMRGVIFYHGESNVGRAAQYRRRFPALIAGWRKAWGQGDFPFLYAQISSFRRKQTRTGFRDARSAGRSYWAEVREAQRLCLAVRHTAMAVTFDIGDYDIHPRNKRDVGLRLALPALALVYGRKSLPYSGPLYMSMAVDGARIHLRFRPGGSGLVARGGKLAGFAIAGSDDRWKWADAEIHGDTVTVSSSKVAAPVKVRYAWHDNPIGNLYNAEGLPASPFQTDGFLP